MRDPGAIDPGSDKAFNEGAPVATATEDSLRFAPSAVEGLPCVTEVAVFPDRLELLSAGKWVAIRFLDIARWHRHGWLYRSLARLGWGIRGYPAVGDRDWFHPPSGRFFRFYTEPPVTVYMPDESRDIGYGHTMFRRVQNVMALGGFGTCDLG
jgi:hypothetical protein